MYEMGSMLDPRGCNTSTLLNKANGGGQEPKVKTSWVPPVGEMLEHAIQSPKVLKGTGDASGRLPRKLPRSPPIKGHRGRRTAEADRRYLCAVRTVVKDCCTSLLQLATMWVMVLAVVGFAIGAFVLVIIDYLCGQAHDVLPW